MLHAAEHCPKKPPFRTVPADRVDGVTSSKDQDRGPCRMPTAVPITLKVKNAFHIDNFGARVNLLRSAAPSQDIPVDVSCSQSSANTTTSFSDCCGPAVSQIRPSDGAEEASGRDSPYRGRPSGPASLFSTDCERVGPATVGGASQSSSAAGSFGELAGDGADSGLASSSRSEAFTRYRSTAALWAERARRIPPAAEPAEQEQSSDALASPTEAVVETEKPSVTGPTVEIDDGDRNRGRDFVLAAPILRCTQTAVATSGEQQCLTSSAESSVVCGVRLSADTTSSTTSRDAVAPVSTAKERSPAHQGLGRSEGRTSGPDLNLVPTGSAEPPGMPMEQSGGQDSTPKSASSRDPRVSAGGRHSTQVFTVGQNPASTRTPPSGSGVAGSQAAAASSKDHNPTLMERLRNLRYSKVCTWLTSDATSSVQEKPASSKASSLEARKLTSSQRASEKSSARAASLQSSSASQAASPRERPTSTQVPAHRGAPTGGPDPGRTISSRRAGSPSALGSRSGSRGANGWCTVSWCGRSMASWEEFVLHYNTAHAREGEPLCPLCLLGRDSPTHRRSHDILIQAHCPECSATFWRQTLLDDHGSRFHRWGDDGGVSAASLARRTAQVTCEVQVCRMPFNSWEANVDHFREMHVTRPKKAQLHCPHCLVYCCHPADLVNHVQKHKFPKPQMDFPCTMCSAHFVNENGLSFHVRNVHDEQDAM